MCIEVQITFHLTSLQKDTVLFFDSDNISWFDVDPGTKRWPEELDDEGYRESKVQQDVRSKNKMQPLELSLELLDSQ